ncbi:MAG: hypothetical protein IBJ00_06900 [Alphaproteobacteria bacterium]|nr:hypothetical protein [Alphaproteobacteria bacterium]
MNFYINSKKISKLFYASIFSVICNVSISQINATDYSAYRVKLDQVIKLANELGDSEYDKTKREDKLNLLKKLATIIVKKHKARLDLSRIEQAHAYKVGQTLGKSYFYVSNDNNLNHDESLAIKRMISEVVENANDYLLSGEGTLTLYADILPTNFKIFSKHSTPQNTFIGYHHESNASSNKVEALFNIGPIIDELHTKLSELKEETARNNDLIPEKSLIWFKDKWNKEANRNSPVDSFYKMYPANPNHQPGRRD